MIRVQLLDMEDNSIDRCNLIFGRFFCHAIGQVGCFIFKVDAPVPSLLLHSAISTPFRGTIPGFTGFQAGIGGSG